jgi:hypothetical protein
VPPGWNEKVWNPTRHHLFTGAPPRARPPGEPGEPNRKPRRPLRPCDPCAELGGLVRGLARQLDCLRDRAVPPGETTSILLCSTTSMKSPFFRWI